MGNEDSKGSYNVSNEGGGIWQEYLGEIKSSQKSDIVPFYKSQILYIQKLFRHLDKTNTKSLQLGDMRNIPGLSQNGFLERIMVLFEQQLIKIKTKKISLQILLHLLQVFHVQTGIEQKGRYLFRVYDWDRDYRLGYNDMVNSLGMLFRQKMVGDRLVSEEMIKNMASQALSKYGVRGQIKLEGFLELINHDQIREVMTIRFSKTFE